jgi:hypothetical protein
VSDARTLIQYVGCRSKTLVREYTFTARLASGDCREFTLTIANEAFRANRARFQDAPDICSHRLHQALADPVDPPPAHIRVSDADLESYRVAHAPRSTNRGFPFRKPPAHA